MNTLVLIGFIILVILGGIIYDFIRSKGEFDQTNRKLNEIKGELKKINENNEVKEGKVIK